MENQSHSACGYSRQQAGIRRVKSKKPTLRSAF
ncbi:hypothetical protein SMQE08_28260 [Serratia marcescens]|nr:hypothetical protein SMQE08_28260 [Serratia marcescens]